MFEEIRMTRQPDGTYIVAVTKSFKPEHGGGRQVFIEHAPSAHRALDVARGMVTVSAGSRTDKAS